VLFAVEAFWIAKLRLALPAAILIATVLFAPESPGRALGWIFYETGFAGGVCMSGRRGFRYALLGLGLLLLARCAEGSERHE